MKIDLEKGVITSTVGEDMKALGFGKCWDALILLSGSIGRQLFDSEKSKADRAYGIVCRNIPVDLQGELRQIHRFLGKKYGLTSERRETEDAYRSVETAIKNDFFSNKYPRYIRQQQEMLRQRTSRKSA